MAKRVYQVWKGKNIFIFNGRLVFGPDARSLIVTLSLIIVPIVIFCTNVARNLLHELSANIEGYAILVVAVVLTIYVLVLLFLTSSRDPGFVPRNSQPPDEEIGYDSSTSIEVGGRQTPARRLPRTREVIVNGVTIRVKYCETCMLYRPPRCSHCTTCNNCVERFDHHCPWVGQCIGMRNYRYFFMFISSSTVLCIFVIAMSALNIKFLMDDYGSIWKAMKESPVSMILMAYCFIFLWFVGGLTCFHLFLIGINQTTYERCRYRGVDRPYNQGCLKNFTEIFCTKIKPSRNNFRAHVNENERRPSFGLTSDGELAQLSDLYGSRREKVEDDREIGGNLLKISQRPEVEDV
ncbi:hypothetical protein SLEP1_g34696 [Rubroshorea leprosula]|uniref:S-acyltransferase n=1 Tax=Rubroshorea leprosula TaxID=152421 RepID=A0AAV5KKW1_9ROSI|nr:hypothetical protein SLEP1_g34696 [Rubroshorea leprosula]